MKNIYYIVLLFLSLYGMSACSKEIQQHHATGLERSRLMVITDINTTPFFEADEHALIYLLWHSNIVRVESIIASQNDDESRNRLDDILDQYSSDYGNNNYGFQTNAYPTPQELSGKVINNLDEATNTIIRTARKEDDHPLYILVLGDMKLIKEALFLAPDIEQKIRLITIGSGIKSPDEDVCGNLNWNGWGRTEVFERFKNLWWIENDWAYKGISEGNLPKQMFSEVQQFGALGNYLSKSTQQKLVLDEALPIMYLLDPNIHRNHPEFGGWTGNYIKPFPVERPQYWIDRAETKKWNYKKPCQSWELADQVLLERKSVIVSRREDMFSSLLMNLDQLYNNTYVPSE
ncbi:DUF1593 domain-containing protein [Flammeovirga yaeyamensis]|uniref:DUF1593 domain-containing protein n=1 Tax=Flammeovirga yaeyamensis TaxID=367791 RepID=A0AAX1NBX2_9BACT|nr:nucleoside hydrolase-like domain-containing protein [Flammeovirga yaeyamensis]MBB3697061.1 hypothetical protein [Flammeovirga yaeyamensis]NMF33723.1 DUF1593 domain-containing protein [Flammeovirga yaeyamensis]QWG05011.1 DUF1593 domain-containing protein [Flammeovirga yaeyamensis]